MSTTTDAQERFRARESVSGDYLQTLLNSLTLESIRDAAYALAPTERISIKNHASSHSAILQTHKSNEEICRKLLSIESATPFKHCLFFKCVAAPELGYVGKEIGTSRAANGVDFRIAATLETPSVWCVTFEHYVEVKEWVQDTPDTKKLSTSSIRHPVVFRLLKKSNVASLNYPGFSQGSGTKREKLVDYQQVLGALLKIIDDLGFKARLLSIRHSLKTFLAAENSRVHRVRADIETAGVGRFDLSSLSQDRAVEESLASLLLPHLDPSTNKDSFLESARRAINNADANSVVLYWHVERVLTRLRFWDIGCEILFVWNGEQASYAIVDDIIELLEGANERLGNRVASNLVIPLQWLTAKTTGETVRPADLAEALNLKPEQARSELMYGVKAGLFAPVYRLRGNHFIAGLSNDWTMRLESLRQLFTTADGIEVDGGDPKNIEVAFRRVGVIGGLK